MLHERQAYLWFSGFEDLDVLNVLNVLNILMIPPPSHLNLHSLLEKVNTVTYLGSCHSAGLQVSIR